jgi:hypothetical protein
LIRRSITQRNKVVSGRSGVCSDFRALAANQSSPVTQWLRALARLAHPECGGSGTRARQSSNQVRKGFGLLLRVVVREILGELTAIGVHDRQLQSCIGTGMPLDQASVVILSRGWTDAAEV